MTFTIEFYSWQYSTVSGPAPKSDSVVIFMYAVQDKKKKNISFNLAKFIIKHHSLH